MEQDLAFWNFLSGRSDECYEMIMAQAYKAGNENMAPIETYAPDESIGAKNLSPRQPRNRDRYSFQMNVQYRGKPIATILFSRYQWS